jgi:DNA-binding transcriptional regulator YiaG
MASKPGSKYHGLHLHLRATGQDEVALALDEIEALMKAALPASAHRSRAFWSNRIEGGYQAAAWLDAGYHVDHVDLEKSRVTFTRVRVGYRVASREDLEAIQWDGEMISALRRHLRASQSELAEMMGVRQQTVSEWENAVYTPGRGRSKNLTVIAERSGFVYGLGESKEA